jgi:oxygen-independent coproporphyrinogen III oxidase
LAGLYIHIPFCKSKCSYCDFYSIANQKQKQDIIECLKLEIENKSQILNSAVVKTIYFGGGTPSVLCVDKISEIFEEVYTRYNIAKDAEVSFEANPEDLTVEYLTKLAKTPVNRLSIGIQSFDDNVLKIMRRRHNAKTAIESVYLAKETGFDNISIDLIYGIYGLSNIEWKIQIETALNLPINHLSAYHLGIEKGTLLYRKLIEDKFHEINESESFRQYEILIDTAKNKNFYQYEISNFAKDNFTSKHNSAYWNGNPYLGFGPSAHSFSENTRSFNVANVKEYIIAIKNKQTYFETEMLSEKDQINERIMLGLRTVKGINIDCFENSFGIDKRNELIEKLKLIKTDNFVLTKDYLVLTKSGMFLSDSIISALFF